MTSIVTQQHDNIEEIKTSNSSIQPSFATRLKVIIYFSAQKSKNNRAPHIVEFQREVLQLSRNYTRTKHCFPEKTFEHIMFLLSYTYILKKDRDLYWKIWDVLFKRANARKVHRIEAKIDKLAKKDDDQLSDE